MTANLAVDAATTENGCLEVVPRSHKMDVTFSTGGQISADWEAAHEWLPVPLQPGKSRTQELEQGETDDLQVISFSLVHTWRIDQTRIVLNTRERWCMPPMPVRLMERIYVRSIMRIGERLSRLIMVCIYEYIFRTGVQSLIGCREGSRYGHGLDSVRICSAVCWEPSCRCDCVIYFYITIMASLKKILGGRFLFWSEIKLKFHLV